MFRKVMLATDFSPPAEQLFNCLEELKTLGTEEVLLLNVVRPTGMAMQIQDRTIKKLEEKEKVLKEKGFKVTSEAPIGFAATEIREISKREEVSLILIGSKGEGFLRRMFLGSTAADLLRMTDKPVLLEKYQEMDGVEECKAFCERKFVKVLFPTDFSEPSLRAFKRIKELKGVTKQIILAHVIDKGVGDDEISSLREEAHRKLEKMKEEISDLGFETDVRVRVGVPSQQVLDIAEDDEVTLIAIASRGEGVIKDLLMGSTAENIAGRSNRPILLFPERK
ncbi:MAG: universal stress protein [Candidatus Contubernalis sp.]|nr:universal stress protein [Candidatus Contubernalis sp.]